MLNKYIKSKFIFLLMILVAMITFEKNVFAAPSVPGDTEVLSNVFREPNGTGPLLLTDKILQITPAKNSQNGSIWSKEKLNLTRDFDISAYLYLGNSLDKAADGITFTLQNDYRMNTLDERLVLGDSGMGLGAYSNKNGGQYVRNALSIEFDTYFNNGSTNRMDREIGENGKRGHIAVVTPKSNNNNYTGEHSSVILAPEYLSNGQWRNVEFHWEASTQTISFSLEGVGSSSYKIPNIQTQFGSNDVYWGFTASTGGFNAENLIAISELPQKYINEATITNKTTNIGPNTKIEASKGDVLELETIISTSPFTETGLNDSTYIEVDIPSGIKPNLQKIQMNNEYIPVENISLKNGILTISGAGLSKTGTSIFSLEAEVISEDEEVVLDSRFKLFDVENKMLSSSNDIYIEIPKRLTGEVLVKYLGSSNESIRDEERLVGAIGSEYTLEIKDIPGFELIEVTGDLVGTFQEELQEVVFRYKAAQYNLVQTVSKIDGSEAITASAEDILVYRVDLKSLFNEKLENVLYESVLIESKLPEYIEEITDLTLRRGKDNQSIGDIAYNKQSHEIIASISNIDQLTRDEDITISYHAKINTEVMENTLINVKAKANVLYSDGLDSGVVDSNQVSTKVTGLVYLSSAPKTMNFGKIVYDATIKRVDDVIYDQDLIVNDTRINKTNWFLGAKLKSQMTNVTKPNKILEDSLQYVNDNKVVILNTGLQPIYQSENEVTEVIKTTNISESWGTKEASNGLKLIVDPSKSEVYSGDYYAEIEWQLMEATP